MKFNHSLPIFLILLLALAFRFYKLASFPPGLYSDEAAFGYNAYSLLISGRDEFGKLWPLTLQSFGDYKPPISAWLAVPFVYIFGLSELAVRFPSALAGVGTVIIVYFLTLEIFKGFKLKKSKLNIELIAIISAFLLTFSPWHILFSRSSMLVGIEAFFISSGILFILKGLRGNPKYFYLSSFLFSFSIYTYYGSRITIPLLLIGFFLFFWKEITLNKRQIAISCILGITLLLPFVYSIYKEPLTITGRAKNVSVFYDENIRLKLWKAHTLDGQNFPVILSRYFNNKIYYYTRDITSRYFEHFSISFLFLDGDSHLPFNLPGMGLIYLIELPFFLLGTVIIIREGTKKSKFLIYYLLVSPIVASFTYLTPSANRSFNLVVPLTIIASLGFAYSLNIFKKRLNVKIFACFMGLIYFISLLYFLNTYFVKIPFLIPQDWHYGRKEMISKLSELEDDYDNVIISNSHGPSYIWILFYKQYDPNKYWRSFKLGSELDSFGFINIDDFDKYSFTKQFNWETLSKGEKLLFVGYEGEIPDWWYQEVDGDGDLYLRLIDKVYYPNGNVAFKFAEVRKRSIDQ